MESIFPNSFHSERGFGFLIWSPEKEIDKLDVRSSTANQPPHSRSRPHGRPHGQIMGCLTAAEGTGRRLRGLASFIIGRVLLLVVTLHNPCQGSECLHGPCRPGNEECGHPVTDGPQFHLTDRSCGMNDPNGIVFVSPA